MADEREKYSDGGVGGGLSASAILSSATREKADAFIDKQNALADLQIEDLQRENAIRHWSLRVRHISDVLKLGFELALGFIVVAIAVGLGLEIWAAAHANGLVIDAFAVPPAMADKGLSGQVVASKLLDRLTFLQSETTSTRAASSFANDWTNDIKVEIPDTGISLGEVVRYLHNTLGQEMHLSGEMYQMPQGGAALTVRIDNDGGQTFAASSGDLDGMIQRAALAVYARAQPYRYSVYLFQHDRIKEAYAESKSLAENGPPEERAWGYIGMSNGADFMGQFEEARNDVLLARKLDPNLLLSHLLVANTEGLLEHEQAAVDAARGTLAFVKSGNSGGTTPKWLKLGTDNANLVVVEVTGDYRAAIEATGSDRWFQPVYGTTEAAVDLALGHDLKGAEAKIAQISQSRLSQITYDSGSDNAAYVQTLVSMSRQDWQAAIGVLMHDRILARESMLRSHGQFSDRATREYFTAPLLAVLYARAGDWAKADTELKPLPLDCDACTRARGKVESIRHNWNAAAHWFALVSARSPDIPLADADWGAMLIAKGDLDGAIAKFASANKKGPHFADPLEMWGEALIAKNRSDLALTKFEEANKYAPKWGRLHLKWGEALWWSGDKNSARKQFAIAAGLDLTPSEKSERTRVMHG
jgi:tetratricopeptide (TPR) repeat protein